MRSLIVITIVACGALLCKGAPTQESIVTVRAEEIPVQELSHVQFNVGRVLDKSLSTITLADFMNFLSESMNKNVQPLVDGWGKFSLRNLLVDWNRRNHEIISNVQNQGEAIISNVHHRGHEIIKNVKHKKEEIISNVHDKGEELLTKKKQVIANIQHTGEKFIEDVLDEAKKKIAVLTPDNDIKRPYYHDESSAGLVFARRKRDTENAEALPDDPLDGEERFVKFDVDTKISNELDAHDASASYPAYAKPVSAYVNSPGPVVAQEYYTLPELAQLFSKWIRKNFTFLRRRPTVTSA